MSRFLCVAALAAIGLIGLANAVRADSPTGTAPATTPTTTQVSTDVVTHASAMRPWRASQTIGIRVDDAQGEKLGKIEDIVFDPGSGHIRYAVLSMGGFLGVGEKWFAVPWKNLRAETKAGTAGNESFVLVLDVEKNKMKNAPGFDSKQWPDFGNPAYGTSVDQFYGDSTTTAHSSTNTK